jgi:hypothetical protein
MSKARYLKHRADDNHWTIKRDLERIYSHVEDIHNGGLADLLVLAYGRWFVIDVKSNGERDNLTKKQNELKLKIGNAIIYAETTQEIIKKIHSKECRI